MHIVEEFRIFIIYIALLQCFVESVADGTQIDWC